MMKRIIIYIITIGVILSSCSSDYRNAIPANSIALLSLDVKGISEADNTGDKSIINSILQIEDIGQSGIDLNERIYLFEDAEGMLGLVACVDNEKKVESWFEDLSQKNKCTKIKERKGYKFSVFNDSFVAGFSKSAIILMGPTIGSGQSKLQAKITKYLGTENDNSIVNTPMYERLDSIETPIAMIIRGQALPEKMLSLFSMGALSKAKPNDILMAASATVSDGCLNIVGETFSFDNDIDLSIKSSLATYHPIEGKYIDCISLNNVLTILSGVNGENYLNLLRNNISFRTLLIGLNTALDIDMILKSIDGDILMAMPSAKGRNFDFQLLANVRDTDWLADVDYWKKTTPSGYEIRNKNDREFFYSGAGWNMYFGINKQNQLYISTTENLAQTAGLPSGERLSECVRNGIRGKRACVIVSLDALTKQIPQLQTAVDIFSSIFGNVNVVVYSMK